MESLKKSDKFVDFMKKFQTNETRDTLAPCMKSLKKSDKFLELSKKLQVTEADDTQTPRSTDIGMEKLNKLDRFLGPVKGFQVIKPQKSSTGGKVVKRPKKQLSISGRGTPTRDGRYVPILKPTPTKPIGVNPNFVSPPHKHRSAFVPVLSPMKPKDKEELVSKLHSGRSVQPLFFSPNEKHHVYDEIKNRDHTLNTKHSSSRDSGFERSNPQNFSYCSDSTGTYKLHTSSNANSRSLQNIIRIPKVPSPVFVRPKTPPYKSGTAEEMSIKTETDLVDTVHFFTSQNQNMFATSEVLFHLNNLQLSITKKISKTILLNRISSLEKMSFCEDASLSSSKNQFVMSWIQKNSLKP